MRGGIAWVIVTMLILSLVSVARAGHQEDQWRLMQATEEQ
jgi:hypothetical protein